MIKALKIYPFHNSVESGLRALMALYEVYPQGMTFERIHYYDYIAVHTEDFGGPQSLHANFPHRTGEYLIRRKLIEDGIELLRRKGLVSLKLSPSGIEYVLTDEAGDFIIGLRTPYINKLQTRISWVHQTYGAIGTSELMAIFNNKLKKWDNYLEFQPINSRAVQR